MGLPFSFALGMRTCRISRQRERRTVLRARLASRWCYALSMKRICVFCGSNQGARPEYRQAAVDFAEVLAARRIGLVYGGASVGLMGVIADKMLACGGEVVGVIPAMLVERELANRKLTELREVNSMHER